MYGQGFFSAKQREQESYYEIAIKVLVSIRRWTGECMRLSKNREVMIVEQLLDVLPIEICICVYKQKQRTMLKVGKFADDYIQARRHSAVVLGVNQSRRMLWLSPEQK